MSWDVLTDIGGQSAYVWGSFGVCVALMAAEIYGLRRRINMSRTAANKARHDR